MNFCIRPAEIEVPADNPFRDDALNRSALEPMLSEFITQTAGPFVLALDSPWGTGKTTFIRMWKETLQQKGYISLYFNAWETDFVDDPLVALIGELEEKITKLSNGGKEDSKFKYFFEKTRKISASILKWSIPTAVRIATYGGVNLNDPLVERELATLAGQIAEEKINAYKASKLEIKDFKKTLEDIVQAISEEGTEKLPIIFFVDELDRCRPSYAVELLERIKHLFEVEGIVFVLGIDRQQLSHSVRAIYGSQFNAEGYLRRFIDIDYQLPELPSGKYCNHLFSKLRINELIQKRKTSDPYEDSELKRLKTTLSALFEVAHLSLREQTQILGRLNIILRTIPLDHPLFPSRLAICVVLREWKPKMYSSLMGGSFDIEGLLKDLQCVPEGKLYNKPIGYRIEATIFAIAKEVGMIVKQLEENLSKRDNKLGLPEHDQRVLIEFDMLNRNNYSLSPVGFRETINRISFSDSFVNFE